MSDNVRRRFGRGNGRGARGASTSGDLAVGARYRRFMIDHRRRSMFGLSGLRQVHSFAHAGMPLGSSWMGSMIGSGGSLLGFFLDLECAGDTVRHAHDRRFASLEAARTAAIRDARATIASWIRAVELDVRRVITVRDETLATRDSTG